MDRTVRVWDRAVRVLHWSLVAAIATSSLALVDALGIGAWHQPAGYVALGIVLVRIVWGFVGSEHARFARFLRSPSITLNYLRLVMRSREPHLLGHNPLGAWMIVALIGCVAALAFTGWLYTTDMFWGSEAVEDVHRALAWGLLGLVALHLAGVIFTSVRQRENLVAAMFHGRKRTHDEA